MDSSKQFTILLVEDDEATRHVEELILVDTGYNVISARDGGEAWNAIQEEPGIDLLLTDIEMPVMDGLELAWRVRTEFPEIQILFTSGSERIRDLPEAMVLVKPFTSEDLLATIERLLLRLRRAA